MEQIEEVGAIVFRLTKEEVLGLCKPGAGPDTCIWLVVGESGFECLYFSRAEGRNLIGQTLEERWEAGETVAKRDGCPEVLEFVEGIKKGIKACKEGKMRPWSEVKQELGL